MLVQNAGMILPVRFCLTQGQTVNECQWRRGSDSGASSLLLNPRTLPLIVWLKIVSCDADISTSGSPVIPDQ